MFKKGKDHDSEHGFVFKEREEKARTAATAFKSNLIVQAEAQLRHACRLTGKNNVRLRDTYRNIPINNTPKGEPFSDSYW